MSEYHANKNRKRLKGIFTSVFQIGIKQNPLRSRIQWILEGLQKVLQDCPWPGHSMTTILILGTQYHSVALIFRFVFFIF